MKAELASFSLDLTREAASDERISHYLSPLVP